MAKVNIKSEKLTPFGGIYYTSKVFYALSLDKVINGTLGVRSSTYNSYQWDEILSAMSDVSLIRVHQLIAYVQNQEVCLPLNRRMRQMDKDGKKMVAEFVYRHTV